MAEEYSRAIARVVAAQLAELEGFDAVQESSIEVLSELLLRYLSELCRSAHEYAEMAGRTDSNVADVVLALEDMGTTVPELQQYLAALQKTPEVIIHTDRRASLLLLLLYPAANVLH